MKYDVIVIGSGLGGLECAFLLARSGRRVLVLEQGAQLGGCIQSYRRNGLAYDTGFHYVGGLDEGQSLHAVFGYMGLLDLSWKRMDACFDRVSFGGQRTFAFAQGYDAFVDTLAADFPAERNALKEYAALLKQSSAHEYSRLNPHEADDAFAARLYETGAWPYLNRTFRDPLLIQVLSGTSLKMELRQESLPLFTFAHGHSSFIESSWRLQGDGSLIVDRLADGIRRQGGDIVCRAKVVELTETDGLLTRARCDNGESYEANIFISDVHPAQTCLWIKQSIHLRKAYRTRIAALANTFGMFTLSLRLKPRSLPYFNYNRYLYRKPDVWNFYRQHGPVGGLLMSCRVPDDGSGYTRQLDLLTPMLWDDCLTWSHTRVGQRGDDYRKLKEQKAEECIDLAETCLPGLRSLIEERYLSTPLTYRDYTGTPEGSAYGLRKDFADPLQTLLSVRTPIPNLLLTGQNLMMHGLQGVTLTALFTCAELLGREAVWKICKPSYSTTTR